MGLPLWHIIFDDNDGPHTAIESYQFRSTARERAAEMASRSRFGYRVVSEREYRAAWRAFSDKQRKL